mgnify:CR=1 FL=1
MLKEVGASGQISLGKKYAGQLFDLQTMEDGRIVLQPVRVVPVVVQEEAAHCGAQVLALAGDWARQHSAEIDQYNAWAAKRQPYSQRVRQWRADKK